MKKERNKLNLVIRPQIGVCVIKDLILKEFVKIKIVLHLNNK